MNRDTTAEQLVEQLRTALNSSSRIPLYEQLAHTIHQAILNGELPPRAMLPPETELAERLGVSRQTVNQALSVLSRRGVVRRRRKVGTIVAEPYVEQPLGGLYSFLRTLTAQGRLPGTRLLGYRTTVDDQASPLLTGREDGLVFELARLRLVDGEPFVVETVYLPVACGEQLSLERLSQEPLYELLREVCQVIITHAEETLRPVILERPEAALLGLAIGEPAFLVERTGYANDQAIELRISLIRGDRYRFRVRLTGSSLTIPD